VSPEAQQLRDHVASATRVAIGLPSWIDHASAEAPAVTLTERGMNLALGDQTVVELAGPEGAPLPYDALHLLATADDASAAGIVVDVPGVERTLHLRPRALEATPVEAGVAGGVNSENPTQVAPDAVPRRIVAVLQSVGDFSSSLADAGAPGRVELACPGEASGIRCELSGAGVTVTGGDLAYAWLVDGGLQHMMPMGLTGFCLFPPCTTAPPACTFPQSRNCTNACGKLSFQYCTLNGTWGACRVPPEVCNGVDDDCDGSIDENGSVLCDDGLTCNIDSCHTAGWHWVPYGYGGYYAPPSGTCQHDIAPSCADSHSCVTAACSWTAPAAAAGTSVVAISAADHCYAVQDDGYCTNTWDGCNCNGPEYCVPSGGDPSGCVSTPPAMLPCEQHDPGEPDDASDPYHVVHHPGNACTTESCIEESPTCNWAHIGIQTSQQLSDAQMAWSYAESLGETHAGTVFVDPLGTTVHVTCPSRSIAGHHTFSEPGCDDNLACTDDVCDPATGACSFSALPAGHRCDPRPTAAHEAQTGIEVPCGISNFACNASGGCISPYGPPSLFWLPSVPDTCQYWSDANGVREASLDGIHYSYGPGHSYVYPSCHTATCQGNGDCGVGLDFAACTTGHGCIQDRCTSSTGARDSNNVIGCNETSVWSWCPTPAPGDCRDRTPASCQPDGSCVLFPNNSKCSMPPGECLVPTCRPDGVCQNIPDLSRCTFSCPPEQSAINQRCNLFTGACEYDCDAVL